MNYIIVGGGPAGTFAAKEIRQKDSTSSISIISQDSYPFYSRPRVPELISGKSTINQISIYQRSWYDEKKIELKLNTIAVSFDSDRKQLKLDGGETMQYEKLLVATGSLPRRIPVKGSEGKGIYTLSSADDALRLNLLARQSKQAIIIGAGFVGIEAAASMASLGVEVTVIEVCDRLLPRQLDTEGSDIIRPRLESLGINFLLNTIVDEIGDAGSKKVVMTKDGKSVQGDFVLIAAGIVSSIALAKDSGIQCNRSIIVNEFMQTDIAGIYAAGDAAEYNGVCYGIWPVSKEQGEIAGKNMAGEAVRYHGSVPVTFLKIAGIDLASVGTIVCSTDTISESISKSSPSAGIYKKAIIAKDIFTGAILIGDTKPAIRLKQAIGKDFSNIKGYWETL